MNSFLVASIKNRKVIELRYHGFSRFVESHAYGRDKNGDEILRCFQASGGSDSGSQSGWKLLKVGEAFSIRVTEQGFSERAGYQKNDKAMEYIFAQL